MISNWYNQIMKARFEWRVMALAAVLGFGAAGCVSLSKYNALKSKENATVQNLGQDQVRIAALKKDNKKLSSELAAARKKLAEFALSVKGDILSAQKELAAALKLVDRNAVATSTSSSVFISTTSTQAR